MKKIMKKLNKHFFPLLVVAVLLAGLCLPIKASAAWGEPLNYADLDYSVKYGTDVNTVTYEINTEWFEFWFDSYKTGVSEKYIGTDTMSLGTVDLNYGFDIAVYPVTEYGFLLSNMPAGTRLCIEIELDQSQIGVTDGGFHQVWERSRYLNSSYQWLTNTKKEATVSALNGDIYTYVLDFVIEDIDGAFIFQPSILFENYTGGSNGRLKLRIVSAYVEMEVSKAFWSQFQTQQNGKLLNDLVNGTPEQDQIANESNNEMTAAAGKLDNLGDQLNSVDKPNADSMNVSADKLLGGMAATSMLTAPVLEIWKNPVALSFLTVVVTIVLISWVFFGKK